MTQYALDIGFDSSLTLPEGANSIYCTHGWAESSDGTSWTQLGQRPSNRAAQMNPGDTLVISFFDCAGTPAGQISDIDIDFGPGADALSIQGEAPYSTDWVDSLTLNSNQSSVGLGWADVQGGSLEAQTLNGGQNNGNGDWEMTISFVIGNSQPFSVDPELQLVGGGG